MAARVAQLQDSRARIIAAADAERRRLERDLHDGAQQRLVALSMQLGLVKRRLAKGEDVADLVAAADAELHAAIVELRDLARGIHPAVLTDRGLAPALRDVAHARGACPSSSTRCPRSACRARSRPPRTSRSPRRSPTSRKLRAGHGRRTSTCAPRDGAPRDRGRRRRRRRRGRPARGSGLRGLADRLGALGGELRVDSPPGQGTRAVGHDPARPARAGAGAAPAPPPARGARRAAPPDRCSRTPSSTRS